jgi:predicted enzyme related to lactoylglutathione lyase
MEVIFSAVLIGVRNILKSKSFYENVLGVTFDEVRPPFSNFYLNNVEFMVEEYTEGREEGWAERYIGRDMGICFQTENIEEFLQKVLEQGGSIVKESIKKPWGMLEAKFADMDGNVFIIEQEIE